MSDAGTPLPPSQPGKDFSLRSLLRNYISLIGLALAAVSLANIIFLFLIDIVSSQSSPYIGIFAYMVMPAFLVTGLLLVPVGMWIERQRHRRRIESLPRFPILDLNSATQRGTIAFFLSTVILFILLTAVGSYRAYEYTDSIQFCGQLCHTVMHPEFTAHQASPHARVTCVDCHVGAGAGWYVRSKLSGARQVIKTVMNTYPRPIETPVANLRPAQETCEQCHWPRKFWGAQLKVIDHFGSDEQNTPRQLQMLIKTGGGDPIFGHASGIHWHMNIGNIITYASDPKRQNIPYVHIQDLKGNVTEYFARDANPSDIAKLSRRRMDCVDCHNRPTHIYLAPDRAVDDALAADRIDPSLPYAKQQSVQVLAAAYKTTPEAMQAIATAIPAFYREKYPQIASAKQAQIQTAVAELQRIFRTTIFPEMKIDWRTHPNNVGHFYFQGCFRCHDGNHVSKDGKTISKDCNACHTMLSQQEGTKSLNASTTGIVFKHPVDLGDLTAVNCSDCHTGGVGP
jgi:hypothetical protein